jgi:antitoxin MazE
MPMQIAKWGNSLAVRIPADVVRALGLKEGDEIELHALEDGTVAVISERQRRQVIAESFRDFRGLRPADFEFDRDEINSRSRD